MSIIRLPFSSLAQNAVVVLSLPTNSFIEYISKIITTDSSSGVDCGVSLADQEDEAALQAPVAECRITDFCPVNQVLRYPKIVVKNYAAAARSGFVMVKITKKPYYNQENTRSV